MTEIKGKNLTEGNVLRQMISFAIPMLIGYFLYTGYSIINTIWVGNLLGKEAVAAASVSFIIVYVLISLSSGASTGTAVLISQYYGAKDNEMVQKIANNSYAISIIISIVLTVISIIFSDSILRALNTPESVFDLASGYLKISLAGFVFMYIFFLVIAILRGIGDTVTVMVFLIISTIINAILDPVLMIGIGPFPKMGLNGAAFASLIAQFMAVFVGLIYTGRKNPLLAFNPKKFNMDKEIILPLIKIGFPTMMQQTLLAVGIGIVSSVVNKYGANTVAAYGVATKVDSLVTMFVMALSAAAATITGQNLGANKPERVREVYKYGIIISVVPALFITSLSILIPKPILSLFVHNSKVLEIGATYLRIVGIGYATATATSIFTGIFSGAGKTLITMIFTIVTLWGIRVPLAVVLSNSPLGYKGIWSAILISNVCGLIINFAYYYKGKWMNNENKVKKVLVDES